VNFNVAMSMLNLLDITSKIDTITMVVIVDRLFLGCNVVCVLNSAVVWAGEVGRTCTIDTACLL
jgi:hypothetical protein